ncbi:MAG: peptidylprolyl isomerase [Clostridia bacterium]|nr:peptidylprolyl isomerase [Clostridia bacterium]
MVNKIFKSLALIIISALLICALTGCTKKEETTNVENTSSSSENVVENTTEKKSDKVRVVDTIDYKAAAEKQFAEPQKGDTIAIIHVEKYGDIKVRFFADKAPKAVENFTTLAKRGYYDGVIFHRVINEFMIQGGDPEGTGYGGESMWGEGFGPELDYELVPYRGSLCMAMSNQPNSIGSQFFITQANYDKEQDDYLREANYPAKLMDEYKNYGGYLSLYLQYTVFGQVYEGMDVVDAIAKVETNPEDDKPLTDVVIKSIEVKEF